MLDNEIIIVKEALRKEILSLIETQTHESIKSDGGMLSVQEVVSELHKQIGIRIDIIRKLENMK
jgi:hypothetical protein